MQAKKLAVQEHGELGQVGCGFPRAKLKHKLPSNKGTLGLPMTANHWKPANAGTVSLALSEPCRIIIDGSGKTTTATVQAANGKFPSNSLSLSAPLGMVLHMTTGPICCFWHMVSNSPRKR